MADNLSRIDNLNTAFPLEKLVVVKGQQYNEFALHPEQHISKVLFQPKSIVKITKYDLAYSN